MLLPVGQDRPSYGWPYITWSIAAICVFVWVFTLDREMDGAIRLGAAAETVEAVVAKYPAARTGLEVVGLPTSVRMQFIDPVFRVGYVTRSHGDYALDAALRELVTAANAIPTLRYGFQPDHPSMGRLFTHMWMHGGFMHLLGNMIFLLIAGSVIEPFWRPIPFIVTYLLGGVFAGVAHALFASAGDVPLVGASGAIAALMGALLVCHPRVRIRMMFTLLPYVLIPFAFFFAHGNPLLVATFALLGVVLVVFAAARGGLLTWVFFVPAWFAMPLWAGLELYDAVRDAGGPVASWAHVGGFVFGLIAGGVMRAANLVAIETSESELDALAPTRAVAASHRPVAPHGSVSSRPHIWRAAQVAAEVTPIDIGVDTAEMQTSWSPEEASAEND